MKRILAGFISLVVGACFLAAIMFTMWLIYSILSLIPTGILTSGMMIAFFIVACWALGGNALEIWEEYKNE